MEKDFDTANAILPEIGQQELEKLSLFLQGQGFLEEALKVTRDAMRKLDLAISMKNEHVAIQLLDQMDAKEEKETAKYWSQIADICMAKGDIQNALVVVGMRYHR